MNREELEERWACWWEDDDGFNIKEGPRQDNIDLFFGEEAADNAAKGSCEEQTKAGEE